MKYSIELHDNFRSSIESNNIADNPFLAKVTALLDEIDRQDAKIAELRAAIQQIKVITADFSYDRKLEQIRDIVNRLSPPPEAK